MGIVAGKLHGTAYDRKYAVEGDEGTTNAALVAEVGQCDSDHKDHRIWRYRSELGDSWAVTECLDNSWQAVSCEASEANVSPYRNNELQTAAIDPQNSHLHR